jgi:Domain of unknown function (DUF4145)
MCHSEQKATGFRTCGHCGNYAPMDIVANYYRSTNPVSDYPEYDDSQPEKGYDYTLLLCLACKEVTLWKSFVDTDDMLESLFSVETLYPPIGLKTSEFPYGVQKAYEAALKARTIDANAYAILLGRLLEIICEDREATGGNLIDKLKFLANKGEIPDKLVDVAHNLRKLRNVGTHEISPGLTNKEIPILDDLIRAILEYIYIAPQLAQRAENSLKNLEKRKMTKQEEEWINNLLE